jgi:TonB family protein
MLLTVQRLLAIAFLFVSFATLAQSDDRKAVALAAPRPVKSPEASQRHLAGNGVFVLQVDKPSGKVTAIQTKKSTGQPLLDASAIQAFQKWRCKPGTVSKITVPVTFTATEDAARY